MKIVSFLIAFVIFSIVILFHELEEVSAANTGLNLTIAASIISVISG